MPKVSVIVPNYCHAPFLHWRIDSVLNQTFRDFELLILDDASPDHSREILEQYRGRDRVRFLYNEQNSGSVFRQWEKGIRATDSDYVWIAESDDWADPKFLERLTAVLDRRPEVGTVYAQSWLVNREFKVTGHASCWTDDLDPDRWKSDYVADGREEIRRYLLVKNTIPNASAVLMRRSVLKQVLPLDTSFRLCGDWMHWMRMLAEADVGFVAENLNFWRQQTSHARSASPGLLEWREGEPILNWACERLQLGGAERDRVLLAFLRRCWKWMESAPTSTPAAARSGPTEIQLTDAQDPWAKVRRRLQGASDAELVNLFAGERAADSELSAFLPRLPSDQIQSQFTGASSHATFLQAVSFVRVIRDFAARHQIPFGGPAQHILDFGCGWGRITQVLLPYFADNAIHGADVMPTALAICRESGLRVHLDRVHSWPPSSYTDASMDFIVAYSVFSHLSEDNAFAWIREFARILKPGGMLAITTRNRDFILYVQTLRQRTNLPDFGKGAARSFTNTEEALAAYDRGDFCFDGAGRGGPGLTQVYGEAAIPRSYVERQYAPYFSIVDFLPPDPERRLDQATIFLVK